VDVPHSGLRPHPTLNDSWLQRLTASAGKSSVPLERAVTILFSASVTKQAHFRASGPSLWNREPAVTQKLQHLAVDLLLDRKEGMACRDDNMIRHARNLRSCDRYTAIVRIADNQ
jgi:hypothetical protein